ncbi:MAG TPA: PQQ-binding-like beta-propeller repeat protein [Vicinamibacterales bacterium]|nr:PQQ-binding-like beta-propeller repeat protein [Vicinamibacterales bacterium]
MTMNLRRFSAAAFLAAGTILGTSALGASDWPEWRGPSRDGRSAETDLPSSWSPQGENLAWRGAIGARSSPVAFGDRLYLLTVTAGDVSTTQERLVALDAETGNVLWERRFSIYLSDVPQHRAAWASPAVDPETGNIFVFTVGAQLAAVSPDGKILWDRSLTEEYGAVTTHGGRTTSPIIHDDKVILNTLMLAWGDLNRPGNRYLAFDKRTGQTIWISSPQARHFDTNYSTPIVVDIPSATAGQPATTAMIVGGTDGAYHALQVNTGQPIWRIDVSKRAILNSPLYRDGVAYITHGEENLGTTQMGMVAAIDARRTGDLEEGAYKWRTFGFMPSFPSPVMDDERLYSVDNGAIVAAFDLETGVKVWERSLGTLQKGSPVLADGKLYVGTENGKVFILRPSATGVEVLDEDLLGTPDSPEVIFASPIVADGRVYVTSMEATYAIGKRRPRAASSNAARRQPGPASAGPATAGSAEQPSNGGGLQASQSKVAHVQVFPYESLLGPGGKQDFRLRLFDAGGNFIREEKPAAATWAVDQLPGTIGADGVYVAGKDSGAGFVKATVGGVTGQARVRVIAPLPWTMDFENPKAEGPPAWWVGAPGKVFRRAVEGVGNVLVRPRDETVGRRAKVLMGPATLDGYTIESDVRATESRRQRGDVGLINQRYVLVLFGNGQKLELHPWQAADEMTARVPFKWEPDTWYRMKLRVDSRPDGTALVRGKVWPTGEPEPEAWTIEKTDTIAHVEGSPGIYGDGISELYFDNIAVYPNK